MIIGDSNARVGDLSEFSDDDNIGLGSLLQGNTRSCKISRRNYCDREIKQNGRSLIELCRTLMIIGNSYAMNSTRLFKLQMEDSLVISGVTSHIII